jgi:NAD(P)-dependent dehydrogenase (short-subunit alcohol dehydrogenase family)
MAQVLAGKAVVITGSGRGLGRAFACASARAGASVVINDLDQDAVDATVREIELTGARAVAEVSSVADWTAAARLIQTCINTFGRIDGLVNNAGVFYSRSPLEETESELRQILEANVLGPQFCGVHALRAMLDFGGGSIVNIGSEAMQGYASMGAYAATKGAVASMTYSWSHHREETATRVNAVLPNAQTRLTPLAPGRTKGARPDASLVAPVVVYLLSDLSAQVNGAVLKFNGTTLRPMLPAALARDELYKAQGWSVEEIADACEGSLAHLLHATRGPAGHHV